MKKGQRNALFSKGITVVLILGFLVAVSGCAHNQWKGEDASSTTAKTSEQTEGEAGAQAADTTSKAPLPRYYDFEDIPVPYELHLDKGESFIYQTVNFKAGVLVLSGRVDASSVISFFGATLPRENWKLLGGFRYHRSIMVFEKGSRICLINVRESALKTHVEIYVAPRVGGMQPATEFKLNK